LIPILPMFVDFLPSPPSPPLASDTDREIAVDMLCSAVADGRLTLAELDERVEAALLARTLRDLAALIADLPAHWPAPRPSPLWQEPGRPELSRPEVQRRARKVSPASRWALIQSLVTAESQSRFA
jgi:hypothetical protein